MSESIPCPNCHSELTYADEEGRMICTQCDYQWEPESEDVAVDAAVKVLDANGNELKDGDTVTLTKDFAIKGAAKALKLGTRVKNIKLTGGDHNISCKIEGFGAMALKSEFVKKA